MNEKELIGKIHSSMYHQLRTCGYAAPVDVLIDTGILPKQKYEDWRFGRVRYLEAVCNANLKRLSFVLHRRSSGAMRPTSSIWRGCKSSKRRSRKQKNNHPAPLQEISAAALFAFWR